MKSLQKCLGKTELIGLLGMAVVNPVSFILFKNEALTGFIIGVSMTLYTFSVFIGNKIGNKKY